MSNNIPLIVDLYQGDLKVKITNEDAVVKSLKALGVPSQKSRLFQFNSISNLSWAFGSNEQILALAFRLFLLGVLPKLLKKYNVPIKEAVEAGKVSVLIGTPEEKNIFKEVLNDKDLLQLIKDVKLYLEGNILKQDLENKIKSYLNNGEIPKEAEKFFIEDLFLILENIDII